MIRQNQTHIKLVLFAIFSSVVVIYIPGTLSGFIFDDFWNLKFLDQFLEDPTFSNGSNLVLSGKAGPLGRPVSLFSFLLQAESWPNHPEHFKLFNVGLHVLTGLAFYTLIPCLARPLQLPMLQNPYTRVIAVTLWLLHPLFASTVLYAVQRMTIVAALFAVLGIQYWLKFRECLAIEETLGKRWHLPLLAITFSTIALFSKENAAAIVFILILLEAFDRRSISSLWTNGRLAILTGLGIGTILSTNFLINLALGGYQYRDFSLTERLISEANILVEYIWQILLPDISRMGVFHDDVIATSSITLKTILTWTAIGIMNFVVMFFNRKAGLACIFGIAWYLAGHSIESTIFPLELYAEHRNYLPAMGIALAVAILLVYAAQKSSRNMVLASAFTLFLIGAETILLWKVSNVWGNPLEHAYENFRAHPHSTRALQNLAGELDKNGDVVLAYRLMRNFGDDTVSPGETAVAMLTYICKGIVGVPNDEISRIIGMLNGANHTVGTITVLRKLVDESTSGNCNILTNQDLVRVLAVLLENRQGWKSNSRYAELYKLQSRLFASEGKWPLALKSIKQANIHHPTAAWIADETMISANAGSCRNARLSFLQLQSEHKEYFDNHEQKLLDHLGQAKCKFETIGKRPSIEKITNNPESNENEIY